jgi:squalene-associated FAD-dependent desaturase
VDRDARGMASMSAGEPSQGGQASGDPARTQGRPGRKYGPARHDDRRSIVVIGGGWSGCAAAVELARHGYCVELDESAPVLGGRARAVERGGLPLDNGEHLLLGAYADTLELASLVHDHARSAPWIRAPLAIRPFSPDQRNALSLRARRLPAPLGLAAGLLGAAGLSWRERIATIRWFARQRSAGFRVAEKATVAQLLETLPARVRDDLWSPLCIAALNTPPAQASAQVFLNVLREAFGGAAHAAEMIVPRGGLAAAIPERAAHWLAARGHVVRVSSRVRVETVAGGVRLVRSTGVAHADAAIVAVGPHQLAAAFDPPLVRADHAIAAAVQDVRRFAWEPITTVYLGYAAEVAVPAGCLVRLDDAPGQWLFDRADILARAVASTARVPVRALLSVVISAHEAVRHPALVKGIDAQLRRLHRGLPALVWSQVIEEKRATYACVPALARPACGHLSGRLYLAGDYTYAAFPATLEAAVRSGRAAARALARDLPP